MKRTLLLSLMIAGAAWSAEAANYYLTVAGLGGEDDYTQRFDGWASDIDGLLSKEPGATVVTLTGDDARKEDIETALKDIAAKATANDQFMLFLIGHGSFDNIDYKFNIPGPDITGTELGGLLNNIKAQQLIVNATSASGGALGALQKPDRVIVSATKSGTEKNATVFARYWVDAFRDAAADADRNESLSALEAFTYAEKKVTEYYETQKRLATEHAMLEDTGEGDGVRDPSAENGKGLIARRMTVLHLGSVADIVNDPAKQELLSRKDQLETAIDELKYRKAAMPSNQYNTQMRQYLLELAMVQEQLDQ